MDLHLFVRAPVIRAERSFPGWVETERIEEPSLSSTIRISCYGPVRITASNMTVTRNVSLIYT